MNEFNSIYFIDGSTVDEYIVAFLEEFVSPSSTVACYTSGSTGAPKRLDVPKSAMLYSARQTVDFFGLDARSVGLLCIPAKYIGGRMMLVRAHLSGMRLYAAPPSLNPLKTLPAGAHVDFAAFTPAQMQEMANDAETAPRLAKIRDVIIGGAAVDPELEKQLLGYPNNLYATYGMTETVSHIALRKLGTEAYVKLGVETVLETDAENCLRIYNPHLTPEPLQTNDVVRLLDESRFVWLGRRDFVINSGGVKLHPEIMEQKIKTLPGWERLNLFVIGEKHPQFGERPVLVVEGNGPVPDMEELKTVLTKLELPEKLLRAEKFIYTESGKLNRAASYAVAG